MEKDFTRIAIVNRGEPAMRFIHAVREYNRENGTSLQAIALYTEPDRRAMFVREADEAVNFGAATYIDRRDGQRKNSYLDYERLERALLESRAEAVWVGWGFVAEHAEFVELCNRLGIVFIGPGAEVMRRLGDKITSKLLAEQAGIPVVPWSGGPVATLDEARFNAEGLGYPLMIKATAGGGGRGIRKVQNSGELTSAFTSAQSEALRAFGDAAVFLEKQIKNARHVEVQIMGDYYGTVWAVGVRDCTIQRRNQKVLEEAPSPLLTLERDRDLRAAAVRLGQTLGYENAGTVEFLFDQGTGNFWFMEVNARLQVEHPVTGLTTGLDLVKLQIHVARGGKLEGRPPDANGHAIEVRLNAEDPANLFAPAPGKVALFRLPTGPGVRIDTGVAEGDEVPAEFDSMIAKIIAHGRDRHEALSRLKRALAETAVIIQGGMSNKGFLLALLDRPEVITSELDVAWLDRLVQKGEHLSRRYAEIALLHAAIEAYLAEVEIEKAKFFTLAHRGRPQVQPRSGITVDLSYQGENYKFSVYRLGLLHYRIDVDGQRLHVFAESLGNSEWRLTIGGESYRVLSMVQGHPHLIEVNGVPHRLSRDHLGVIRAPSPAVVISTLVKAGEIVKAGDRLALLEAMKMEMSIVAPFAGTVKEILVRNNIQVDTDAPLLMVEPCGQQTGVVGAERVSFAHLASAPVAKHDLASRCAQNMGEWNGRSLLYLRF
ncbi:ATP-grasp domain-containing protein [candidate division KSB1 bacterium]|nr:ATP-grasp domain-containing protein [candidate division KSB1 bacterium]